MFLYQNIKNLGITNVATCLKVFPSSKVIGWILPQMNSSTRIISNVNGEDFSSFIPSYTTFSFKLPPAQVMMNNDWIKGINIDPLECAKRMIMPGKQLRQKTSGKYESQSLLTPFRIIALMLNRIFGRVDGNLYKLSWVPLIYYVAFEGTIFNWQDIILEILSSYVTTA